MALIQLRMKTQRRFSTDRRPPHEVFGWSTEGGPSAKGNSTFKRMRMCPREHALASFARLRRIGDHEALTQGITFHYALEHYYLEIQRAQQELLAQAAAFSDTTRPLRMLPEAQRKLLYWNSIELAEGRAWDVIEPMKDEPGYEETYEEIERMLASYFDAYRRKDPWLILAVEENLEFWIERSVSINLRGADAILEPVFGYTARLDLIVEDLETNRTLIIEHKTARTLTDDLIDGYQLDQQILGQAWLFTNCVDMAKYAPFGGVIVNITTKHKLPKHQRVDVLPSRYHLGAFQESIIHWNSLEREFEKRGWPKALGNCAGPARYWSRCDFYNVCYGMPELAVSDLAKLNDPPHGYRHATQEDLDREAREEE